MLEVCVVGWSAKDKSARMVEFSNHENDYEAKWIPAGSRGISHFPNVPRESMPQGIESLSPDDQLVANVLAMGQWLADNQGIPTGGEIVAHEVSAKGIETRILHRFADYEDTKRDGAAIYGRLQRGDYDPDMLRNSLVSVDQAERMVERKAS
jgi:hypothetical protein